MAINLTVAEVREFYPTSASDVTVQDEIDAVIEDYGQCLEANYSEAKAKRLAKYMVALNLSTAVSSGGGGAVKGQTAPNGAKVEYDTSQQSANIKDNIERADTANCLGITADDSEGGFVLGTLGANLNNSGCY